MEILKMKKYVLQKTLKEHKQGEIVQLDNNSFFTIYWIKKGVVKPLEQIEQQKTQVKQENAVKQPKKTVKKGNKKK